MNRNLIILGAVVIVGVVVMWALVSGYQLPLPSMQQVPQATPMPTPQMSPPPQTGQTDGDVLQKLRQRLYQEGVTTSATVEQTFPGSGFILRDNLGNRMFVRHVEEEPPVGSRVTGSVSGLNITDLALIQAIAGRDL